MLPIAILRRSLLHVQSHSIAYKIHFITIHSTLGVEQDLLTMLPLNFKLAIVNAKFHMRVDTIEMIQKNWPHGTVHAIVAWLKPHWKEWAQAKSVRKRSFTDKYDSSLILDRHYRELMTFATWSVFQCSPINIMMLTKPVVAPKTQFIRNDTPACMVFIYFCKQIKQLAYI